MPVVHALLAGIALGAGVAAQLGPMSLLLIRATLRGGAGAGLAVGAGIALVDGLYAALGAAGAAPLLTIGPLRTLLGLLGAGVLLLIGVRTIAAATRVRAGLETAAEVATPRRAFATAVAGTASNPLTIASWAAVFAAASTAGVAGDAPVLLVAGVGLGSLLSTAALTGLAAAGARWATPRVLGRVDVVAGVLIAAFGALLAGRTLRDV